MVNKGYIMSPSELVTYATCLIQCVNNKNNTMSSGTGFIMHLCIKDDLCIPVLITNKHVIKDADTCLFSICKKNPDGSPNNLEIVNIFAPDMTAWVPHPNPDTDLCCLPIGEAIRDLEVRGIQLFYAPLATNLLPTDEDIKTFSALEEVVMVGYPRALADKYNHKPLMRRGITATDIKNNYEGRSEFVVDMACFPGSSGSPVFILNEGLYAMGGSAFAGNRVKFLGVLYAGPIFNAKGEIMLSNTPEAKNTSTAIPMNLGFVIKSSEILAFEPLLYEALKKTQSNA